ncbi:TPA: hypothetical protein I7303_24170 [Vibrio parahaemolyticus]|nr:hypothetical protein [Vibrio parahaemolyticus]HAS6967094.1 hypothetical protein [Vibrio parahaemolyticus]
MSDGQGFELLTTSIFEKLLDNDLYQNVEHNVKLESIDGDLRQIDILITAKVAGMELKTIVECKDYKSKISVGKIDALHSVMMDVRANKAVMVSKSGFSSGAIKKAKRLGISLYTAHEALSKDWEIDIEIPVIIEELIPVEIKPSMEGFFRKGDSFHKDALFKVNDIDLIEQFKVQWYKDGSRPFALKNGDYYTMDLPDITPPYFIRGNSGSKVFLKDFKFTYKLENRSFFGYLNEQRDTQLLKNITDDQVNILFNIKELLDYEATFLACDESILEEVKDLCLFVTTKPSFDISTSVANAEFLRIHHEQ